MKSISSVLSSIPPCCSSSSSSSSSSFALSSRSLSMADVQVRTRRVRRPMLLLLRPSFLKSSTVSPSLPPISAALQPPLDLTEDNVKQVLLDARSEFAQIFDSSVGITGEAELAELDGPFVKITLRGRFWHERSIVLARLDNYLKKRIPEILEVNIEDDKQLDDSPENF